MEEVDALGFYERASAFLSASSEKRSLYLRAVDELVKEELRRADTSMSWLDVGAGTGERTASLAANFAGLVTALEPANSLADSLPQHLPNSRIVRCPLEDFSETNPPLFDFITALWNVPGHSSSPQKFFSSARRILGPNGIFMADLNNRLNLAEYGVKNLRQRLRCAVFPKTYELPRFQLRATEDSQVLVTTVWLSAPRELRVLLNKSGFEKVEMKYVHYGTGQVLNHNFFRGQILVKAYCE